MIIDKVNFSKKGLRSFHDVLNGSESFLILKLLKRSSVIHVSLNQEKLNIIKNSILKIDSSIKVLIFPAWDCLPYDRVSPNIEIQTERMSSLGFISQLKDNSLTPDQIIQENNDGKLKKKWLIESINQLNDRERKIIISRNSEEGKETLDCIGKKLNISKERVRQIETAALKKLKKNILQISSQPKEFFI